MLYLNHQVVIHHFDSKNHEPTADGICINTYTKTMNQRRLPMVRTQ